MGRIPCLPGSLSGKDGYLCQIWLWSRGAPPEKTGGSFRCEKLPLRNTVNLTGWENELARNPVHEFVNGRI